MEQSTYCEEKISCKSPQDIYCFDCQKCICYKCGFENHKTHESELISKITDKFSESKKEIKSLLDNEREIISGSLSVEREKMEFFDKLNKNLCDKRDLLHVIRELTLKSKLQRSFSKEFSLSFLDFCDGNFEVEKNLFRVYSNQMLEWISWLESKDKDLNNYIKKSKEMFDGKDGAKLSSKQEDRMNVDTFKENFKKEFEPPAFNFSSFNEVTKKIEEMKQLKIFESKEGIDEREFVPCKDIVIHGFNINHIENDEFSSISGQSNRQAIHTTESRNKTYNEWNSKKTSSEATAKRASSKKDEKEKAESKCTEDTPVIKNNPKTTTKKIKKLKENEIGIGSTSSSTKNSIGRRRKIEDISSLINSSYASSSGKANIADYSSLGLDDEEFEKELQLDSKTDFSLINDFNASYNKLCNFKTLTYLLDKCPKLLFLNLEKNNLTVYVFKEIFSNKAFESLLSLNLGSNQIKNINRFNLKDIFGDVKRERALALETLIVSKNGFFYYDMLKFICESKIFAKLKKLDLSDNQEERKSELKVDRSHINLNLKSLEELILGENGITEVELTDLIKTSSLLSHVLKLNLSGNRFGDAGVIRFTSALKTFKFLELDLTNVDLSSQVWKTLFTKTFENLEVLTLDKNTSFRDEFYYKFGNTTFLTNLKHLKLRDTNLDDNYVQILASGEKIKSLSILDLSDNTKLTENSLKILSKIQKAKVKFILRNIPFLLGRVYKRLQTSPDFEFK